MSARCSWSQVSAFQHYRNLPLTTLILPPPPPNTTTPCPPPPPPPPQLGTNIRPPHTLGSSSLLLPRPHSSRHNPSRLLWLHSPVSDIVRPCPLTNAYTGPISLIATPTRRLPPEPFCPFFIQTSAGPVLQAPYASYIPLPSCTSPPLPHPPYLRQTIPPTLTHWWFST